MTLAFIENSKKGKELEQIKKYIITKEKSDIEIAKGYLGIENRYKKHKYSKDVCEKTLWLLRGEIRRTLAQCAKEQKE